MKARARVTAALAGLGIVLLGVPTTAVPESYLGAVLLVESNGSVVARFLGDPSALYDNELYLDAPIALGPVFNNHVTPVGATETLGTFAADDLLEIRNRAFYAPDPGSYDVDFYTGPGVANPDGLPHARFTFDPEEVGGEVTVAFEDQLGGGDLDFDDAVYSFSNARVGLVEDGIGSFNPPEGTVAIGESEVRALAAPSQQFTNQGAIANSGSLFLYGTLESSGSVSNAGLLFGDLPSWIENQLGALLENSGTLYAAGLLENSGTMSNTGTIVVSGWLANAADGTFVNDLGEIRVVGGAAALDNAGAFSNGGQISISGSLGSNYGTWTNEPGSSLILHENTNVFQASAGRVHNLGDVEIRGGSSLNGAGIYEQDGAGITVVNGLLEGHPIDLQGGVLSGAGALAGVLNAGAGATIAPGNSVGTLMLDGDFQLDGGTLAIELVSPTEHDVLFIVGAAAFTGGTVSYEFQFTPEPGQSFTFLSAPGGISGAETLSFDVSGPVEGLGFDTEVVGTDLVLTVLPEPAALSALIAGAAAIAGLARRRRGARCERDAKATAPR